MNGVKDTYENYIKRHNDPLRPKTKDDTFTPEGIYEALYDDIEDLLNLRHYKIERPFYPDKDYKEEAKKYTNNTVVFDNPPFSLLKEIIDFYNEKGIKYVLFCPGVLFLRYAVFAGGAIAGFDQIIYDNGAKISSALCTNMLNAVVLAPFTNTNNEIKKEKAKMKKPLKQNDKLTSGKVYTVAKHLNSYYVIPYEDIKKDSSLYGGYYIDDDELKQLREAVENEDF